MGEHWNESPAALFQTAGPLNKRMLLTKLTAASVLQAEVPPCAPAGEAGGAPLRS